MVRAEGRLAGLAVACDTFRLLDPRLAVERLSADGRDAGAGETVAVVRGPLRPILTAERTALNFFGHLAGIATTTRDIVDALIGAGAGVGTGARIVCTRKTTPGLRALEKHAVRCGGGANHRFGLDDAVLIKDNHRAVAGGVRPAIERARAAVGHLVKIEVEVDTLEELEEALAAGVDAVLLDNMAPETLRRAVALCRKGRRTGGDGGVRRDHAGDGAGGGGDGGRPDLGRLDHPQRAEPRRGAGRRLAVRKRPVSAGAGREGPTTGEETMGDKGGRKDKDKSQKQEARKQKAKTKAKEAKQPKSKV